MAKKAHQFGISPLMSMEELAAYLRVSPPMVRAWVKSGATHLPPSINVGSEAKPVIRFMASEVQKHILSLRSKDKMLKISSQKEADPDIVDIAAIEDDD